MRDLKSNIASRQSIAPALRTVTATGSAVDRLGFESVTFNVHVGDWTDGTHAFSVEHSDDNVTYSAVTSDELIGAAPTIADDGQSPSGIPTFENENVLVGYKGHKRHIRAKITTTGSPATGAFIGVDVILGHANTRPT